MSRVGAGKLREGWERTGWGRTRSLKGEPLLLLAWTSRRKPWGEVERSEASARPASVRAEPAHRMRPKRAAKISAARDRAGELSYLRALAS